jgi:hypothetical protein
MKLHKIVRLARTRSFVLRQGATEPAKTDWVSTKNKKEAPKTGDPHSGGGVVLYRNSIEGVREALPFLINEGVRIGRVIKLGKPDPGQKYLVEVYKPGSNSMIQEEGGDWVLKPNQGKPGAIIVYVEEDQMTWTGDSFASFDEALFASKEVGV